MSTDETSLYLKQVRECDGQCCKDSPRFPIVIDGTRTCKFLDIQANGLHCSIQRGTAKVPSGMSVPLPHLTNQEAFQLTCIDWPTNRIGRNTGGCCW